jgi:hypothetical protein
MDILEKLDKIITEVGAGGGMSGASVGNSSAGGATGPKDSGANVDRNVALNLAKGKVDVIGGKCQKGFHYDSKKKVCVPDEVKESSTVGGTYVSGNSTVAGSGQTRVWGFAERNVNTLAFKNKEESEDDDQTKRNMSRKGLRFNKKSGAFEPEEWDNFDEQ